MRIQILILGFKGVNDLWEELKPTSVWTIPDRWALTFWIDFEISISQSRPAIERKNRMSSVGRALDCKAGDRGFDSQGRASTQGLKITENWRYSLCTASGWTFAWLGWPRKMAVPSQVGNVNIVSPISTFLLNISTLKKAHFLIFNFSLDRTLARGTGLIFFGFFQARTSECEAGVKREAHSAHSPHRACVVLTHVLRLPSVAWETRENKQKVTHVTHNTLLLDHVHQVIYNNECSSSSYSSTERMKDSVNSVPKL